MCGSKMLWRGSCRAAMTCGGSLRLPIVSRSEVRDFRYSSPVSPLRNKIIAPPIIDRDIGEGTRRQ
jgi:hypothetical protein